MPWLLLDDAQFVIIGKKIFWGGGKVGHRQGESTLVKDSADLEELLVVPGRRGTPRLSSMPSALAIFTCRPNSHPFQERHVYLDEPIKIGRSVARCRPAQNNATFDCKVLSRNHALVWFDHKTGKVMSPTLSWRRVFACSTCLAFARLSGGAVMQDPRLCTLRENTAQSLGGSSGSGGNGSEVVEWKTEGIVTKCLRGRWAA